MTTDEVNSMARFATWVAGCDCDVVVETEEVGPDVFRVEALHGDRCLLMRRLNRDNS